MNGQKAFKPSVRVSPAGILARTAERVWQAFAVLSVGAICWWYFVEHSLAAHSRTYMMALGAIGATLAVLAAALTIRKRFAYQGVGKLSAWMSAHIYLGAVSAFAIIFHSGFRAGGLLSVVLLVFFWLTVATGVLGLWLSRKIPPLLTAMEENPAIVDELLSARADCLRGMMELAAAGSADFSALVRRRLWNETASWPRMLRFYRNRSTLDQELPAFQKEHEPLLKQLGQFEHRAFQRAAEYALRTNKMNAELFLHRVLRGWLTLHVTATAMFFGLAAIHIFTVLYY